MSELLSFQWASGGGPVSLQEAGLRLVLAIVLSAGVGLDRELKHKPLGLRTNMLVALGAASFSLMALQLVHEFAGGPSSTQVDPIRVMEAIVGAIGFLGAAAISSRGVSSCSAPPPGRASGWSAPSAWRAASAFTRWRSPSP